MSSQVKGNLSEETTLKEALKAMLDDKKLLDVELESSDGVVVGANRSILAARSKMLHAMLYGADKENGFRESKNNVVKIGFSEQVLRAIVQYCQTDEADIFSSDCDCEKARLVISLLVAADYYDLAGLHRMASHWLTSVLAGQPSLALSILDEASAAGSPACQLAESALNAMRRSTKPFMEPESLATIHPTTLETVLSDKYTDADEYSLFCLLNKWATAIDVATDSNSSPLKSETRHDIATRLARHIRLEAIPASHLSSAVESSSFVAADRVVQAYKKQALEFEKSAFLSKKPRLESYPFWKTSRSDIPTFLDVGECTMDMIVCTPLRTGVHKWSIKLESYNDDWHSHMFLGVASTAYDHTEADECGNLAGIWDYNAQGEAHHNNEKVDEEHPTYEEGCVVNFVLNLQEGTGTLSASVDDGPQFQLFSDLSSQLDDEGLHGFVPCATAGDVESKCRFLGFEPVQES